MLKKSEFYKKKNGFLGVLRRISYFFFKKY